jgi:hypothetical protein
VPQPVVRPRQIAMTARENEHRRMFASLRRRGSNCELRGREQRAFAEQNGIVPSEGAEE